ncbi:copper homeostasis membrane protein CopD [Herbaspirillum chlorophenolicum]|uniref:Copper homeostasis membrane protein CopD n=1 Tax=Herbaspirillum chlorophenolicum TaxID=211589 RepID=A0ABW8EX77_9BURK
MNSAQSALLLCRFVYDTSALFLWGISIFLAAMVPPGLRLDLWRRLGKCRCALTLSIGAAVCATLPLQASVIGDGWADAKRLDVLAAVANETSIGKAWWCQLAGFALLLCLSRVKQSRAIGATAFVSGGLLASLALTGHAAMDDGVRGVLHHLNDVAHVLAAGAWIGALPVVLMLQPHFKDPATASVAIRVLRRFSTAGHVVVAIVVLSGAASTFLILGGMPTDWAYPYQRLLALKMLVVIGMIAVAIVNRYVLVPAMRRGPVASAHFYRMTVAEIAMSIIAVFLVAWFGMLEPH